MSKHTSRERDEAPSAFVVAIRALRYGMDDMSIAFLAMRRERDHALARADAAEAALAALAALKEAK